MPEDQRKPDTPDESPVANETTADQEPVAATEETHGDAVDAVDQGPADEMEESESATDVLDDAGDEPAAALEERPEDAPEVTDAADESDDDPSLVERAAEAVQSAAGAAGGAVASAADAVTTLLGEAYDAVSDRIGSLEESPAETVVEPEASAPTSIESARQLRHTGHHGYTGEVIGRVVTLAELNQVDEEAQDDPGYGQLRLLIEQTLTNVSENEIVRGRVVSIGEKDVVIDIGFKSDGIVSKNEFDHELHPGDEVEVFLERIEDYQGQLVLSKTRADKVQRWQRIERAFDNEEVLEGTIVRRIKGGMIVELFDGVEAFLPGSQIDVRPVRDFDAYLDKRMEFKIVKLNPANENIVVSHKALIEKELEAQRGKILSTMEPGQVLEGTVKNITDFGVFIDLGGVDGLLHITDLSWGRVSHPSELVGLDEKLNIVVLDYDKERQRISLGLKQLQPHPWDNIREKYLEGTVVEGKVVSITDYGAFVELEKGIEGLVHISEMSWTEHIRHPSQMVALGQLVNVKILNIDHEGKKISLGMKQLQPDPWVGISERYPPGTVLRGRVRNITNFGVFVEIEPGIDGLVHISDLSWTKRIRHPSEIVKKGQELDVVILNIDEKERRISLGHKQVETNPWNQFAKIYAEGTDTEGRVSRIEERGLVVDLPLDVEGFVPIAELKSAAHTFQDNYHEGDQLDLQVIRFDANNKEIVLSETAKQRSEERAARDVEERERRASRDRERREVRQYTERGPAATGPTTLGELSGLADLRAQMAAAERARDEGEAPELPLAGETPPVDEPAPPAEEGSEDEPTIITTAKASTEIEAQPGMGNRGTIGKRSEEGGGLGRSNTEPPAERGQRREEAGQFPPAEGSQAALKGTGEAEKEGSAEAAEEFTEDKTPVRGTSEKPLATLETGESVDEVESFTRPTDADDRVILAEDVGKPEEDETATVEAELGDASVRIVASSPEEADDLAAMTREEATPDEGAEEASPDEAEEASGDEEEEPRA
jgi:small subunit ribosomal protein S1